MSAVVTWFVQWLASAAYAAILIIGAMFLSGYDEHALWSDLGHTDRLVALATWLILTFLLKRRIDMIADHRQDKGE